RGFRKICGQSRAVRHLRSENLKLEDQPQLFQQSESPSPLLVVHQIGALGKSILGIGVPVQLLPNPAEKRAFKMSGQRFSHVRFRKIGKANNGIWVPKFFRDTLDPAGLVDFLVGNPVNLHIDGLSYSAVSDIRQVLLDGVVSPDRFIFPKYSWGGLAREPRKILHLPDVMMRVDDFHKLTSFAT
ncbi:MAG: hypothetical protein QOI53_1720, partial [Verrucomicrobiota bacterium]|nr:hypothetical protein [Verrucomicrobiota bacterium]